MVGYLKGYAYDFEVTRVLNPSREIDYVFGIDIPCLAERGKSIDLEDALPKLWEKTSGRNGVFLNRCFSELASSMKHADDTAFYCYRAVESLRHHCAAVHGLSDADKSKQWEKFRKSRGAAKRLFVSSRRQLIRYVTVKRLGSVPKTAPSCSQVLGTSSRDT